MSGKTENKRKERYLRTDLTAEENRRLTEELANDPALLRELLQIESVANETFSAEPLFDDLNQSEQDALDDRLRKYLLRDPTLSEKETTEIEDLTIEDERYFERMSMIESELIEGRLSGALSADEKQRFDRYFLVTPERREKLKNTKLLMLGARSVRPPEQPEPKSLPLWKSLLASFDLSNMFAAAAAASVLLFLALGALFWLNQKSERGEPLVVSAPTNDSTQIPNQPNASNQPVNTGEAGNAPPANITPPTNAASPAPTKSPQSIREPKKNENPAPTPFVKPAVDAPRSVVFALVTGVSRNESNGGAEKKIEPGAKVVELQLRLDVEREYENFRIIVQDSDGNEIGRRDKLKATKKRGLPSVTATLPAASFKPDDYTVILSGSTKGAYEEAARYSFRVLK
ncbi:MAG TPA: hypothetical protein VF596_13045 [Pyrinomonadaceae bacterium]|jgi:hypothetical protein